MLLRKIKKHLDIQPRRLRESSVIKNALSHKNVTLESVVRAFIDTKKNQLSPQDLDIISNCESYREKLLSDNTPISYEFFGSDTVKPVSEICKKAASPEIWCRFIYLLIKRLSAKKVLEIGTNLGVSGNYILSALGEKGRLVTMEGLPKFCEIAENQFSQVSSKNGYRIIQGLYDETFLNLVAEETGFDLLFIDGNHRKKPTLEYFAKLKGNINQPALFIFDDINWDDEMKDAWSTIKLDQEVNYTIDLYKQGLAIVDKSDPNRNVNFELFLSN